MWVSEELGELWQPGEEQQGREEGYRLDGLVQQAFDIHNGLLTRAVEEVARSAVGALQKG